MPAAHSAGILLHRGDRDACQVLLVHPGGPLWARRDDGAWSIPKGELGAEEEPLAAAVREFAEELGVPLAAAAADAVLGALDLGQVRQRAGKVVRAFAVAGDLDVTRVVSNAFEMEWPPRSGRRQSFPEIDRAAWFEIAAARVKINPAQAVLLDRLLAALA